MELNRVKDVMALFTTFTLLFNCFVSVAFMRTTVQAQRPIVVSADQPNIWTLEQAHYLLAQMHRRNLDLKAASLEALDANAINGINVDALKTLLSVSAEFDQAIGTNNKLLKDEKTASAVRKRDLSGRKAKLEDESLALTRQLAELKIKHLRAKSEDEKKEIQSEIDELTIVREAVKEQLTQTNEDLKSLSNSSSKFESLSLGETSNLESGTYANVFQTTAQKVIDQFNNAPKLNASLRLDNYLQMQYEILSKQLTLLRDEVGPGERLIFMEIPQSVNASHDRANDKWAQSWWKIAGYSECIVYQNGNKRVPCSKVLPLLNRKEVQDKISSAEIADNIRSFDPKTEYMSFATSLTLSPDDLRKNYRIESEFAVNQSDIVQRLFGHLSPGMRSVIEQYRAGERLEMTDQRLHAFREDVLRVLNLFITNQILQGYKFSSDARFGRGNPLASLQSTLPSDSAIYRRLYLENEFSWIRPIERFSQNVIDLGATTNSDAVWGNAENRSVRVVDLFPRQSSLNVNDLKLRNSSFSFKFVFQLLSGLGASTNYQRQREQYSQFVQQELYSSAFGKGSREFGWTFNPMPGTRRLLSGVRTTYAIVVVPQDATSIILQSKGCYFSRTSPQPSSFDDASWNGGIANAANDCMNPRKFIVPIPDSGALGNNLVVTEVNYRPVKKGERVVVDIQGKNFSSQIGVLVNGIPLTQSLGLGQPFIRDDSTTGQATRTEIASGKVKGTFERIGASKIVATFEMDKDYEGVPIITLVAPGEAVELNSAEGLRVNGKYNYYTYPISPRDWWEYMFGTRVGTKENEVVVDKISVFQVNDKLNIVIAGKNLNRVKTVYVNGELKANPNFAPDIPPLPTPTPGAFPARPAPDPHFEQRYLIALTNLDPRPSEKSIQLALLSVDGASTPAAVDNPSFKKQGSEAAKINYDFDETKLTISAAPTLLRCEENAGKIVAAVFEIKGLGYTDTTKAFLALDKDTEAEQEFIFEASTRGAVRVTNPGFELILVLRDPSSKLKTRKLIAWKKPSDGCQQVVTPTTN